MRRTSLIIIALLALLALPAYALAYQASVQASANRTEVGKGETFTYKLSVIEEGEASEPVRLVPPDFTGFEVTGRFSSSSVQVIETKARRVTDQEYRLSSEIPGEHVIPPAKLLLTDPKTGKEQEIPSPSVKVTVLEKGPGLLKGIQEDIRDIKAPKSFADKVRLFFLGMVALVVLVFFLLLGLAIYMVKRKKKPAPAKPGVVPAGALSPRDAALEALRRAESLMTDDKAFYSAVIDALRQYMKAAHGIPAVEATTREIIGQLEKFPALQEHREELKTILFEADLVKFAKFAPGEEDKRRFLEKAKSLILGS